MIASGILESSYEKENVTKPGMLQAAGLADVGVVQ